MKKNQLIEKQFKELIAQGERVFTTVWNPPSNVIGGRRRVDAQGSQQWATSSVTFLGRLFGTNSDYYKEFKKGFTLPGYESDMKLAMAVLQAAWNDYSSGYLATVNALITAEVFDDFLEQAEYLFEQDFHQPAAVIAGAVLEDTLRKLCNENAVVLPAQPKLDSMNTELVRKDVYSKLIQKQITWLADIRNKAAHGQWDKFSKADVENMLRQIREFVTAHMA